MVRVSMALVLCGLAVGPLFGQNARFVWKAGQVLNYRVEHQTQVTEVTREGKSATKTKLSLVKRWQVQGVDTSGIATLQHSLTRLRMETTTPSGETMLFDSADPDKSDPKLREHVSKVVGVPLATIRVDSMGHVVEVKESKHGPASRFESDPPFVLELKAGAAFQPEKSWERNYNITQEPPQGTGERYEAVQKYTCTKVEGTTAWVSLTTDLRTQPAGLADRVPLLQMQPEGVVVFDTANGRLHSTRLKVQKELKGHAGEGSSYTFQSDYSEQFIGDR